MNKIRKWRIEILIILDIISIILSYIFAFFVKFGMNVSSGYIHRYTRIMPLIIILYLIPLSIFKMYRSLWSNVGIDEVLNGLIACNIGTLLTYIFNKVLNYQIPFSIQLASGIFIFFLITCLRVSYRVYRHIVIYEIGKNLNYKKRVLVIGAGSCAHIVIDEMFKNKEMNMMPVGIIDDNNIKKGTFLRGVKVLGNRKDIKKIAKERRVDLILIAISKISAKDKKEILEICQQTNIKTKVIPGVYEIMDGQVNLTKMRDVNLKDLLGREEIKLDKEYVGSYLENKVVLVTGGGGSIGSELCRQISRFNPKKLLILDIYENSVYDLQNELSRTVPNIEKIVIIASVRDRKRMANIFKKYKPQVVFHAAAHKHVPLMENNPGEAIKNNVVGTLNTAELASNYGAERFVLISTDKAVNPTNIMGASKRLCEMIIQGLNKKSSTEFVAVRFGNVLGSNGSVIPLFKKQIKEGGPITLTHKDITRYFMLIPEAVQLVLQASAYANGGEIFVLDMGSPVKIYDLAENLIKLSGLKPYEDIDIKITGLREGEKLYEELLMSEEGLEKTPHEKIFIGRPGDFDINELKKDISELLDFAISENEYLIREKMKDIVPTYVEVNYENNIEEAAISVE
ncbi:nucleoside-diphosphate sugar epimerase/dehydratase [Clostridium sp.]|uniref:polysaccharide biosynthesis protein n=1 Tax=Clostridium sp. TaxID=1506 RepID=UPI002A91134F|nr:nucleoside-diphosphate sugar epimerase/dehydratase [Clostridium sp.]MDY6011755.1 nucleoside-diphosphate sugar epimerase/dehydratase [Clostridium sp.]